MASPPGRSASASTLKDLEQKITDQVECAICQHDCDNPKTLPCGHVYCLQCLEQLLARVKRLDSTADSIDCPQCRKTATIPSKVEGELAGLPAAFHVNSLLDIREAMQSAQQPPTFKCSQCGPQSPATAFCQTCSMFICELCKEVHVKWANYEDHDIIGFEASGLLKTVVDETCPRHATQKMVYFCKDCDMLFCKSCHDSNTHSGHRRKSVTDAVHECKDTITACLHPLKEHQTSLDLAILRVDAKLGHVKQQAEDTKSQIDAEINRMQAALEQRRNALKKEVGGIAEGKVEALGVQKKGLEEVQSQLSGYVTVVEHCLKNGANQQVIAMRKAIQKRVADISATYYNRVRVLPVEEANLIFLPGEKLLQDTATFGRVASSSVCPSRCNVSGDGLETATVGEDAYFNITTFDQEGRPCREMLQLVSLELVSSLDSSTQVGKRVRQFENQHTFSYHPVTNGRHQLYLKINGANVIGSPFSVTVYPSLRFYGTFVRGITGFKRPWGISITRSGKAVVIDNTGWRGVHVINKDGTPAMDSFSDSAAWSPVMYLTGVANGQCYEPRGVAVDGDDSIYVVDGKAHRIQQFSSTGSFLKSVGSQGKAPLQFFDPIGVAVNQETREVYVCDRRNNRIQVLTADLSFVREFGQCGDGPGDLYLPWDIDIDSHGNVFVADCGHCCIKVFTPEGRYVRSIGCQGTENGEFQYLTSVCIDKDDFVYAADKEKNSISVFHPQGHFVMQFGTPGSNAGQLYYPMGVAVDRDGFVYVSDSYNGRVQVFK